MNKLFRILDGIINSDYADENLSTPDSVIAYAESAGDVISYAQAEKVIAVGSAWRKEIEEGNGEWSRMREEAKEALSDEA
jgi:hypothetical protein